MKQFNFNVVKVKDPETGQYSGLPAIAGESAYEIAIRLGTFVGTEEEWINMVQANMDNSMPSVNHGTSDTTFSLTPNVQHIWGEVTSLDLTLAEGNSGVANVYWFSFTSGETATQLTLPETIVTDLIVQPNTYYEISIVDNYMVYADWSVTA